MNVDSPTSKRRGATQWRSSGGDWVRPPLRQATRRPSIDVTAEALDDAHDDERWIILDQALELAVRGGVEDVHALLRPSARFAGLARLTLQTCIPKEYP